MFKFERDGKTMKARTVLQAAAFRASGWQEVIEDSGEGAVQESSTYGASGEAKAATTTETDAAKATTAKKADTTKTEK